MKLQIKISVITITFLIIFSGCVKDNCPDKIHDLDFYNQIMVYEDFATIKFLRNSKDTVTFSAGKADKNYEVVPADCGNEKYQQVIQKFKYNTTDSFDIQYSKMLMSEPNWENFSIIFNKIYFQGQPKDIVNCTENIDILGKSYCVEKCKPVADFSGPIKGNEFIYYSKDFGIVKAFVNGNTYERLP